MVNAPSKITLSGRGIILAGLDFNANSGILADYLVGTASGSRYMKLSHLRFNGCAAGATDGKWIYIQGFYATIEYCTLTERPDTIRNTTIAFMPNLSEGGVAVPRMHKVRYCYFGPRYAVPQDTSSDADNGFESLRIGVGDVQTYDMQVTVERNVFYRSIWRTDGATAGEPEIISIKSKGNKILNNTILESQGASASEVERVAQWRATSSLVADITTLQRACAQDGQRQPGWYPGDRGGSDRPKQLHCKCRRQWDPCSAVRYVW